MKCSVNFLPILDPAQVDNAISLSFWLSFYAFNRRSNLILTLEILLDCRMHKNWANELWNVFSAAADLEVAIFSPPPPDVGSRPVNIHPEIQRKNR